MSKREHISYSELKDWNTCPHLHKKSWIEKVAKFEGIRIAIDAKYEDSAAEYPAAYFPVGIHCLLKQHIIIYLTAVHVWDSLNSVVPSLMLPILWIAPPLHIIASASVVFPVEACPVKAILIMLSVV